MLLIFPKCMRYHQIGHFFGINLEVIVNSNKTKVRKRITLIMMMGSIHMTSKTEAILWSIALPGFAQILNKKLLKGIVFIFLEFLINVNSHFNTAIMASFLGEIDRAFQVLDYQWLMFYPCVYMFAMWDAVKDSVQGKMSSYSFLPFVCSAYSVTVGLMYSPIVQVKGIYIGPIFFPMLSVIPGLGIGAMLMYLLRKLEKKKE